MLGRLTGARSAGKVDPDRALVSEAVTRAVPVLGLLGAQLGRVVEATQDAALSLMGRLQDVDSATGDLVDEAGVLAELTSRQAAEMAEIAQASRGTGEAIEKLLAYVVRRDQTVIDLVAEVRGLADQLAVIQKISRATTTLALNAKIEAGRAGAMGAGFQVVADEVRELSRQSDTAARDIGARIDQLASRLGTALRDHADDAVRQGVEPAGDDTLTGRIRCVATEQNALVDRLETFTGQVEETARALVASSSTVHRLTTTIVAECQSQDVHRQVIEHVVTSLDRLGAELVSTADVLTGHRDVGTIAGVEAGLERIEAGYVMQEQRRVHAETLGDVRTEGDGPAIELF